MKNKVICPTCDDICKLVIDWNDIYIPKISGKIWVKFINYQCDSCSESFTTSEIDDINVIEISRCMRKYNRKSVIKKLFK